MNPSPLPLGPVQRFGVLGGSFNPVHVGHLSIAQQLGKALRLECVFLMPAATSPHKQKDPDMASAGDRLAMCRLAVRHMRGLAVSDLELQREGVSYTVDTARVLRAAYGPEAEIRFLIGSDSLAELPTWKDVRELLSLVDFAVAERREAPLREALWERVENELGAPAAKKLREGVRPVEWVDLSSTRVREMLRAGEPLRGYLRRDVEAYIRSKGLYGARPGPKRSNGLRWKRPDHK